MGQYRTVIVKVGGKIPELYTEFEPTELHKLLNNGFEIKEVYHTVTQPASGDVVCVGIVVITYILFKP